MAAPELASTGAGGDAGSHYLLDRPRLLRQLTHALRAGHVFVIAPAGYGKSTLLRALVAHHPNSHIVQLSVVDSDLAVLRERSEPFLRPPQTLVFDDVHHLAGHEQALEWLADQLRRSDVHLVVAGRFNPLPDPHVYRAVHITWDMLAFTKDEGQALLTEALGGLSDLLRIWQQRTQGWPLALAMIVRQAALPTAPAAASAALFAYLARTLLAGLPEDVQQFLRVTAVPLRCSLTLATVLWPGDEHEVPGLWNEVHCRHLFLEPAGEPGWFRYHELIREFLLDTLPFDPQPLTAQAVAWFSTHHAPELAIEHALDGSLYDTAANLIEQVPFAALRSRGRHLTYRRWVLELPEPVRAAHPQLLLQLGALVHQLPGLRDEAWRVVQEVMHLANFTQDDTLYLAARTRAGFFHYQEGNYPVALDVARTVLADPACQGKQRLLALRLLTVTLSESTQFAAARRAYDEAMSLAFYEGDVEELHFNRNNLALTVLIPLGQFEEAARLLDAEIQHFAGTPGLRLRALVAWCDLCTARGDWPGLQATLLAADDLCRQLETVERGDQLWLAFYRGVLATGQGRFAEAEHHARQMADLAQEHNPLAMLSVDWLESRRLRLQGHPQAAMARMAPIIDAAGRPAYWKSSLALEHDIAHLLAGTGDWAEFSLHRETLRLVGWRARADLVRLRALLTVLCWQQADPRWRRHARSVRRAVQRRDDVQLLTRRDPDLGARFAATLLDAGVEAEWAQAMLTTIGNPDPLYPLLQSPAAPVRQAAAVSLSLVGDERAMPKLADALARESEAVTARTLETALARLEALPPPPLHVKLLGDFVLWRGEERVPENAWFRPIVRRLFQYFVLHRGRPLAKDQIIEDLWPDSPPAQGSTAFRTAYSRLRQALDPYTRPKAPARYFAVARDTYRFDPAGLCTVDALDLLTTVDTAVRQATGQDVLPIPAHLLDTLEQYAPLLPELPYAEWLLEHRERLLDRYVDGCLYLAEAYLQRNHMGETQVWAQRAVESAPWSELGYQLLMRAQARQGLRALALRTFHHAVIALQRELGIEPSPATQWLAERLRRGEEI